MTTGVSRFTPRRFGAYGRNTMNTVSYVCGCEVLSQPVCHDTRHLSGQSAVCVTALSREPHCEPKPRSRDSAFPVNLRARGHNRLTFSDGISAQSHTQCTAESIRFEENWMAVSCGQPRDAASSERLRNYKDSARKISNSAQSIY